MLKLNSVVKSFGGIRATREVSFEVKQGQFFGIIGSNGAGKTTLLNLITGYMRPSSGTIEFCGQPIHGLPPYRISHLGIGRTFQITEPFAEMSVIDNVMIGALFSKNGAHRSLNEARRMCEEPLRLVGLVDQADSKAGVLPLGAKKKLELARVLATEPKLLLLDEVMGGLTPADIDDLIETLRRIHASGTTVVMIEHVLQAIMDLSDHVFVLNFGVKLFEGTPAEVSKHPEVISAYLGSALVGDEALRRD